MNNLSVLTIPVTNKPVTPPSPGQLYVYFSPEKEFMSLDANGVEERLHLKKYAETIALTEEFVILNVRDTETIEIGGDHTRALDPGKLFVIDGSTGGENDKLFTVQTSVRDGENTVIVVREGGLKNLGDNGAVHIERQVTINHKVGTKAIVFSLSEAATGEGEIRVNFTIPDADNLVLTPVVPVPGALLLTVVG